MKFLVEILIVNKCQSVHKALPQIVSRPHTLGGYFFSIATISNVLDLDGEHHTGVWPIHLQCHTKRNNVSFELPSEWDLSHQICSHPQAEGVGHAESDGDEKSRN
jgi:hypothetical protein